MHSQNVLTTVVPSLMPSWHVHCKHAHSVSSTELSYSGRGEPTERYEDFVIEDASVAAREKKLLERVHGNALASQAKPFTGYPAAIEISPAHHLTQIHSRILQMATQLLHGCPGRTGLLAQSKGAPAKGNQAEHLREIN